MPSLFFGGGLGRDLHLAVVHPPVDGDEVVEVLAVVVEVDRVVEGGLVVVVLVDAGLVELVDAGLEVVDWTGEALLAGGWEPHSKTAGPGMV